MGTKKRESQEYYESLLSEELTGVTFHSKKGTLEASPSDFWDLLEGFAIGRTKQLQKSLKTEKASFEKSIEAMEQAILDNLAELATEMGPEYGKRKWRISEDTGIPLDVLTVLLKRLKEQGKIYLMMIWNESTGTPDGSGYALVYKNQ
jgi:hypothetical protein